MRTYIFGFSLGLVLLAPLFSFAACTGSTCAATSTESTTFGQNLYVNGTVQKGSGSFVIDHPLDPKYKLLYHSFAESPDMKNLYDGMVTLDERGEAVVALPRYFLALNKDFRYLATGVSSPMPNLHLKRGVRRQWFFGAPSFRLGGGTPGGEVSWQVTGVRKDPLALKRPIVVEVDKEGSGVIGRGEYLFPEFYAGRE